MILITKNKKKCFVPIATFIFLLCFVSSIESSISRKHPGNNIYSVTDLDMLRRNIRYLNHDSLVVFDVDETLITSRFPVSPYFDIENSNLLDKRTPQLIHLLQKQKIPVIALTQCLSERDIEFELGKIIPFRNFRFLQLSQKKVGIDFSTAFPTILNTYLPIQTENPPLFYNGIIFTNDIENKGIVLNAFLNKFKINPNFIIFIDDNYKHTVEVATALKKRRYSETDSKHKYLCLRYLPPIGLDY